MRLRDARACCTWAKLARIDGNALPRGLPLPRRSDHRRRRAATARSWPLRSSPRSVATGTCANCTRSGRSTASTGTRAIQLPGAPRRAARARALPPASPQLRAGAGRAVRAGATRPAAGDTRPHRLKPARSRPDRAGRRCQALSAPRPRPTLLFSPVIADVVPGAAAASPETPRPSGRRALARRAPGRRPLACVPWPPRSPTCTCTASIRWSIRRSASRSWSALRARWGSPRWRSPTRTTCSRW